MAEAWGQAVICPVLIGRTAHLATLLQLIPEISGEHGGFHGALISGEAGIGKSRLVDEIKIGVAEHGFDVLQGSCFELDRGLPYAPLLDLLRDYCAARPPQALAQDLGPTADELARLLPDLASILPDLAPLPPILDPEQEKHRLFQALTQFFVRLAMRQPLLVIFEDLHWSDETSLEFLLHLAHRIRSLPIFLLFTCRSDETAPALDQFRGELARRRLVAEVGLSPLSPDEMHQMVRAIFQLTQPVHADFRDALYALTEGNPFFLEEILRALIAAGEIFYTNGRWERKPLEELHMPHTIQMAVQRRLEQLSANARKALVLAAVAGRRFDFSVLQALLQQGGVELSTEVELPIEPGMLQVDHWELLALLKEMIAVHLVVEESAERFAFRHALTRQAVLTSLLARERQALHGLVAETTERLYADSLDRHLASLAEHFFEAGGWQKALDYAHRAGEYALALYTPRAAAVQFTRALEAARRLGLLPDADLYRARGRAHETLGEFEAAQADYEAALQAACDTGQRQAEWEALLNLGFLWSARDYQLTGDYFRRALTLARDLDDPVRVAYTLNRLGNWHVNRGRPWEAIEYHRESLAIFEAESDDSGLAETLDFLGLAWMIANDLAESYACYQRAVALFRRLDHRQALINSLALMNVCAGHNYADTLSPAAHLLETVAQGEKAWQMAQELGWPAGEAFAKLELAFCVGIQGEYGHALELAASALEIAEEIHHLQWQIGAHAALGGLYLHLYAPATAASHLDRAIDMARPLGSVLWLRLAAALRVRLYLLKREFDQAQTFIWEFLGDDASIETMATAIVMDRELWAAQAELALVRHQPQEALEIVSALLATLSPANIEMGGIPVRLAQLQAQALMALGQYRDAEAVLLLARQIARNRGDRHRLWQTDAILIRLYRQQRRYDEAHACLADARALLEQLAATVPDIEGDSMLRDQFLHAALAALPELPARSPRQVAKDAFGGLTQRERDVAGLVAHGLSNRDIAEQLVLSERTVEKHVSNILGKLDFGSRAQIATWAVGNGLDGSDE